MAVGETQVNGEKAGLFFSNNSCGNISTPTSQDLLLKIPALFNILTPVVKPHLNLSILLLHVSQ